MSLSSLRIFLCALFLVLGTAAFSAQPIYLINGAIAQEAAHQSADDFKTLDFYDDQFNRFTDYTNGYILSIPHDMQLDLSLGAVSSVFFNATTRIEVYHDTLAGSANAHDYIEYSNRFTNNTSDHSVSEDTTFYAENCKVHLLKWSRAALNKLPNDKNYYACAEVVKNSQDIYTVFIKSSQPITYDKAMLKTFTLLPKQEGTPHNAKEHLASKTPMNEETSAFLKKYFFPESSLAWGIFEPSAPDYLLPLNKLEENLGYSFKFLVRYQTLEENLPIIALEEAYNRGKYVELTLQTVLPSVSTVNALQASSSVQANNSIIYDILSGKYDAYFIQYAQSLKAFSHPVLFRFNNEMNGDWCWYSSFYTSKDTTLYIALWRYLHDLFRENGVNNCLWVWNPHDVSRPDFKWNHYLMYYPGDEYVDIIGLTGYNNGNYFPGEKWRSFTEIYSPLYHEYSALFHKPFMITEFAASSFGGDKPLWIRDMFQHIGEYPSIKAAVWWSGIDYDSQNRPGRIYLLDETEETSNAFRENLKNY